MLEVNNMETSYGQSQVLFGIDLKINQGEVVTLLGRNGMGKTTTINSIMGLVKTKSGEIILMVIMSKNGHHTKLPGQVLALCLKVARFFQILACTKTSRQPLQTGLKRGIRGH